jgi:hypothetical protein
MAVSKAEFLWREWILGEGRYAGKGPRSQPRPNVGYGDPSQGQKPVPQTWWQRLEEFLARRDDHAEPEPPPLDPEQLSPHFRTSEFNCKDGRKVPAIAIPALRQLCLTYLEPMRTIFGPCLVMSGYRPKDYNAKIGGAPLSQHIYELTPSSVAGDLIFRTGTPAQWATLADNLGAGGVGRYPSFVHVDNRPDRARWTG